MGSWSTSGSRLDSWLYGSVFWHARTQERVFTLTFDDGPCHPNTEQLLEVLDREGVRATFFQIGNSVRREPKLTAEVASRHVVANHTYDHPHLVWSRPGTIREQLALRKPSTTQWAPSLNCFG